MKEKFKWFIIGVIVTLVISNSIGLAVSNAKQITVYFNFVKLLVDWKEVKADTILYNGTTYVPIRKVAEMLNKKVIWNEKKRTVNIVNKTPKDIKKEVLEIVKEAKKRKPVEPGKAYIEITASSDPVYWVVDKRSGNDYWPYTLTFKEINGVGLTVEEISKTAYYEGGRGGRLIYDKYDIREWWGDNYISPYSFKVLGCGDGRCTTDYIIWEIKGTDDNGNKVEYKYCLTMSQEPLSEHKNEVFKLLYEAKQKSPKEENKAYIEISSSPEPVYSVNGNWFYTLVFKETNGIGLTVEEIWEVPFSYTGMGNYSVYYKDEIIKWWGDNYIKGNSYKVLTGGCRADRTENIVWIIKGTDDNGNKVEYKYCMTMSREPLSEHQNDIVKVVPNKEYDTHNLRFNADFEVEVAERIWWVPANKLGKSVLTNEQIAELAKKSPEEKQKEIHTLYEALQLFQISNFRGADDNIRIREGDIDWEHHKPGYHAVRTNEGCCASSANWLNYILKDDYEEVGFIAFSQLDGRGHVFNYIKHNGYYYVIDLTHYRLDFKDGTAPETGDLADYVNSDRVLGNIHKVKSLEDYVRYFRQNSNDPPELFFAYTADNCLPLDGVHREDFIEITYPNTHDIHVIYDDPNDTLVPKFVEPPREEPDWSAIPTAKIESVMPK